MWPYAHNCFQPKTQAHKLIVIIKIRLLEIMKSYEKLVQVREK